MVKEIKPIPYQENVLAPNVIRDHKVRLENQYYRILTNLSITRFKWERLPNTVSERFLELMLFRQGLSVFFKHDYFGYLSLRGSGGGSWNMYDDPINFMVTGNMQINMTVKASDCVPIWANYLRTPDSDIVWNYASQLAEYDRTVQIMTRQARRPYIAKAGQTQRLSIENIMRQQDEGQPVVYTTPGFDVNSIEFFPTAQHPDAILNMQVSKSKTWNEAMTFLGINNGNQDKRERLIVSEVSANDEQVGTSRSVGLRSRKEAALLINKKYGLDISVDWAEGNMDMGLDYLEQSATSTTGRMGN